MAMICTGCGSQKSIEEIRAEHPDAIACCPERHMVDLDLWKVMERVARLEKIVGHLCPDKSNDV